MTTLNNTEGSNRKCQISGLKAIHPEVIATERYTPSMALGKKKARSKMNAYLQERRKAAESFNKSPQATRSPKRAMDMDSDMKTETVTESWANSMDGIRTD